MLTFFIFPLLNILSESPPLPSLSWFCLNPWYFHPRMGFSHTTLCIDFSFNFIVYFFVFRCVKPSFLFIYLGLNYLERNEFSFLFGVTIEWTFVFLIKICFAWWRGEDESMLCVGIHCESPKMVESTMKTLSDGIKPQYFILKKLCSYSVKF